MFLATLLSALLLAQVSPDAAPIGAGACLDSPRQVPRLLVAPADRSHQIVRIDKVESTGSMTPGEVIGYLYSLGDGTTWLGQRTQPYMSAVAATQINEVLSQTHMPGHNVSQFPPEKRQGIPTGYTQFFQVQITPMAMTNLKIQLVPCVAWPAGRTLPDPQM